MTLMLQPAQFVERFQESARGLHGNLADPAFLPRLAHTLLSAPGGWRAPRVAVAIVAWMVWQLARSPEEAAPPPETMAA